MNPKVRALIWAELRVGGPMMAVTLFMALVALGAFWMDEYSRKELVHYNQLSLGSYMLFLWGPLFLTVLLVLKKGNTGQLTSGFSRSVLQLPVDTSTAVGAALGMRLLMILLAGGVMALAFFLVTGKGLGLAPVLLLMEIYLVVQVLDWLRTVSITTAIVLSGLIAALLFAGLGDFGRWAGAGGGAIPVSPLFLAQFAAVSVAAGAAGWFLVSKARCQETLSGWTIASGWADRGAGGGASDAFASPQAAQCWYELRRSGLLLPKMLLMIWLLGGGFILAVNRFVMGGAAHGERGAVSWMMVYFSFQLFPLIALQLAALIWNLRNTEWKAKKSVQKGVGLGAPVTRAEAAWARMVSGGVNLAIALAMTWCLYMAGYVLVGGGFGLRVMGESLAFHETSAHELAGLLAGPMLLAGVVAWALMNTPILVFPAFFGLYLVLWLGMTQIMPGHANQQAWNLALIACILWLAGASVVAGRLGLLSRRAVFGCLILWLTLAAGFYPWARPMPREDAVQAGLMCLGVAAWLAWTYPNLVLFPRGGGVLGGFHRENPLPQRYGALSNTAGAGGKYWAVALMMAAGLVWLQWPMEPAWKALFRERGWPTNQKELAAWYTPVPEPENLAAKYLAAHALFPVIYRRGVNFEDEQNLVLFGKAEMDRTGAIAPEVWETSNRYWQAFGVPVAVRLHEIAASGLTKSRYPLNLLDINKDERQHLSQVRDLARVLSLEAWIAAVNQQPEAAANAVLDTLPLAKSMEAEPLLISQLVRIVLQEAALRSLEQVMNRASLPENELNRLQQGLAGAVTPLEGGPFVNRGLVGEEIINLTEVNNNEPIGSWLMDSLGIRRLDRMVIFRCYENLRKNAYRGGDAAPKQASAADAFFDHGKGPNNTVLLAPTAWTVLPALARSIEAELRVHTNFDLAITALAVERFRLAQGRLPKTLDELVPACLDKIARDPWNHGKPLSYRVKDNGEFVVYSFALNGKDDHGEEVKDNRGWFNGDLTFTVAPPEVRQRPQVAAAAVS